MSSEKYIKDVTSISDNLSSKYILSSLREVQEIRLKSIIGLSLLEKLKALVTDNLVGDPANSQYKELLSRCQDYLAYMTIADVMNKVSFKVGNIGVVRSTDEQTQAASTQEVDKMIDFYEAKADFFCMEMQQWILDNRADFPELNDNTCSKMHAHLRSAASCGIFLGGARGKSRR